MKFIYRKVENKISDIVDGGDTCHILHLEGGQLFFEASKDGVRIMGSSQWFQPEEGECPLPVAEFQEFMVRLRSAFEFAAMEQAKERKNIEARKLLLSVK